MEKKGVLTKILAIGGTLLTWFPILTPILLTVAFLLAEGQFRFDYLMPAELFPAALVGGGLLFWTALRIRSRQKIIGWSVVIAAAALVGSQGSAIVTGLASGAREPTGWPLLLVLALLVIYILALVTLEICSILLLRDLFRSRGVS